MRRAIKFALTMGSAALIVSGAATAGPPTPYDQWTAVGGDIRASNGTDPLSCPTGFSCGSGVVGDGFLQRALTDDTTGVQYFQTIITDTGATGSPGDLPFSDESYVRSALGGSSTVGGIAGKQRVNDAASELFTTSELNMGWAQDVGAAAPQLDLQQSVSESSTGFSSGFNFRLESDSSVQIDIDQEVLLLDNTGLSDNDKQVFALRQLGAPSAGSASLPNGATFDWTTDENIKAIWVGQDMPSTAQVFGFQSYSSVDDLSSLASHFSLSETGPWDWAPVFGTEPSF